MTRRWFSRLVSFALLALPALAPAQVDFDALHAGVAGCPEIAADPDVGSLGAFLCQPIDRTNLDAPINQTGSKFREARAGSFHPYTRPSLLQSAHGSLGDVEFVRLQSLLLDARHDRDRYADLRPGAKCPTCPLECESADPGNCD